MIGSLRSVVVDCQDPRGLATFYAGLLGGTVDAEDDTWVVLTEPYNRATYELHDRAGEFTSVLFAQTRCPKESELLLGGPILPAMQNFLLAAA
jgi:hypothetical protein